MARACRRAGCTTESSGLRVLVVDMSVLLGKRSITDQMLARAFESECHLFLSCVPLVANGMLWVPTRRERGPVPLGANFRNDRSQSAALVHLPDAGRSAHAS